MYPPCMRKALNHIGRWSAFAFVILPLAVFGPFVGNEFVSLDDSYLIYANAAVKTLSLTNILYVFTHYDPQLYIPLTFLSFQFNAAIFGMNATAFHTVNLLLHCANVVLALLIIRRLSGNLFVASVTAALFAIHPIQTEAVLWAAARKDLLSGFFFLLSTLWYLKFREHDSVRKNLHLSVCFFALALLSKVSVIMLPFWLLGIDWLQRRDVRRPMFTEKIPYGILAVFFGGVAVIGKSRILQSSGTLLNILLPAKSVAFYLEKFAWPTGLSVIYPYSGQSVIADVAWSAGLVVLLVAVLIFLAVRGKRRLFAFGLGTYFLLLVPSFTTFWKNGFLYFASDRYVYLASIGIFLIVALVLNLMKNRIHRRFGSGMPGILIAGVLIVALIPVTRAQSGVWANTEMLYRNVLRFYPDSVMAHTNLGLELQHEKKLAEARQHYERAIELDPHSVHAYFNLSSLNTEEGKTEEAKQITLSIVDAFGPEQILSPSDLRPFLWLVGKLERIGRPDESLRLLQKLVSIVPQYPEIHHALAEWNRGQGNDAAALREFEAAAGLGSRDAKTYYYLVEYYSGGSGTTLQVIDALQKGVDLDPANAAARQKLQELKASPR